MKSQKSMWKEGALESQHIDHFSILADRRLPLLPDTRHVGRLARLEDHAVALVVEKGS